ncbi:MAG: helix-turn-helix domain-containing protein [Sulfurovum sp.]|nr:helix-turn-helix domain-containing protein [Sulfurovum sp.]
MSEKQNIVKETAKALGMTQKELAERIGVSESTLRKWSSEDGQVPDSAKVTLNLLLELDNKNKILANLKKAFSDLQNI